MRIDGWAIIYRESAIRGQTAGSKRFVYMCHGWSIFLIPYWYVFVFAKSNRSASQGNEICSTLAHTKLSARAIRFHFIDGKVWAAMCSIFLLRNRIYTRHFYAWKESAFLTSINFNPISCFYHAAIILEILLYDDNFDYIWGDAASFLFPDLWYKCDSAEHAPSYVDAINLNSKSCSSPVTCYCIPIFLYFIEGAQKPIEYGECQMLQLDMYWSLDIWPDCLKRFTEYRSNTMSWFRPFPSCCHPIYIFQVLCLHHIVYCRL